MLAPSWRPLLDFRLARGVDEEGIAMSKIANLFGLLEQLESSQIAVKHNRCLLVRNRNAECLKCLNACTSGCIALNSDSNEVSVSPEKCISCGACATACPTGAIIMRDPDDSQLLREIAAKMQVAEGAAAVVCERLAERAEGLYDLEKLTRVPCLGRVDESMICALAAMGAKSITLVQGECGTCAYSQGLETVCAVVQNAETLLKTWNAPTRVKISAKLPSAVRLEGDASYDRSKREAFGDAKRVSAKAAGAAASTALDEALGSAAASRKSASPKYAKVGKDGTLPQALPNRRARLNGALRALGEPEDVMIETRLWGHVIMDEQNCRGCRMCALFCPTGALKKFEEPDGTCGITHAPSLCVKCGLCRSVCPGNCIEISEEVFAVDMLKDEVDRYVTKAIEVVPSNAHQIHQKMKQSLGFNALYER